MTRSWRPSIAGCASMRPRPISNGWTGSSHRRRARMAELDVRELFERAVVNGLSNPDPLIRQRNALRVPTDAHSGPAVRAALVRLAAEDPSELVRAACADALAFL